MKKARKAPKVIYKAAPASRLSDRDARVIGPICESLARAKGVVRAEDLLSVARDPDSPVHRFFEWDDSAAAEKYRLDQARHLMRSYVVVMTKSEVSQDVRGLQFVDSRGGYVPSSVVFTDADLTREVVAAAKREAEHWFRRHQKLRSVAELEGIFDAIEEAVIKPAGKERPAA